MKHLLCRGRNLPRRGTAVPHRVSQRFQVKVEYLTTLCPFGSSFLSVKSADWYLLHSCGFGVEAGPYSGRRMRLVKPRMLVSVAQQFKLHSIERGLPTETFFPYRINATLRDALAELFLAIPALSDDESANDSTVRALVNRLTMETSIGQSAIQNFGEGVMFLPLDSVQSGPEHCARLLDSFGEDDGAGWRRLRPPASASLSVAVASAFTGQSSAQQLDPTTVVFAAADAQHALETTHAVLHALLPGLFTQVQREPEVNLGLDDEDVEVSGVRIALCSAVLSTGVVELEDVSASVIEFTATKSATFRFRVVERTAPVCSLTSNQCAALIIHGAELLSHRALNELRSRLQGNHRLLRAADDDAQQSSGAAQRRTGLIPKWAPLNGGITVVCVGAATTRRAAEDAEPRQEPFYISLSTAPYSSRAGAAAVADARRALLQHVIHAVGAPSADSVSVTCREALPELCVRESLVQSFLRSSRRVSHAAVVALLESSARGAGSWFLDPSHNSTCEKWPLKLVVEELNYVKLAAECGTTSGSAVARLERLLEQVPLLKYIGVRHEGLVQFHDVSCVTRPLLDSQFAMDVEKRWRWATDRASAGEGVGMCNNQRTQLVLRRSEELSGKEQRLLSLVSLGSACFSYLSVVLPPRPSQTGVCAVACVHQSTPLSLIDDAVLKRVHLLLPLGAEIRRAVTRCVVFPLDFIKFCDGSVRRVVAIRVVVSGDSPEDVVEAAEFAAAALPAALHDIHKTSTPFALEPVPRRVFDSHSVDSASPLVDKCADSGGQQAAVEEGSTTHELPPSNPTEKMFPLVDEHQCLIYPNLLEQRLYALAAAAIPDATFCSGSVVHVVVDTCVLLVGTLSSSHVELDFSGGAAAWQPATVRASAVGTVSRFECADLVRQSQGVPQHSRRALDLYSQHQRHGREGFQLPVVAFSAADINVCSVTDDSVSMYLALVLPCCVSVGGGRTRSNFDYVLPLVVLPLVAASHCGINYRHDALHCGIQNSLLASLARREPFVDALSRRASVAVFREPTEVKARRSSNIRMAVLKASTIVEDLASSTTPTDAHAIGDAAAESVEELLCASPQFTKEVFF